MNREVICFDAVAPARERGLKYALPLLLYLLYIRRSREGAWIEIKERRQGQTCQGVAPARERGLKYGHYWGEDTVMVSRSREGAWIEIIFIRMKKTCKKSRSREGAWIEIRLYLAT